MLLKPGDDGAEICAAFASRFAHHFRFRRVLEFLEAWHQNLSDDSEPWLMRGKLFRRWKNWAGAEAEFKEALKRNPNLYEARLALASVLASQRKFEEAENIIAPVGTTMKIV